MMSPLGSEGALSEVGEQEADSLPSGVVVEDAVFEAGDSVVLEGILLLLGRLSALLDGILSLFGEAVVCDESDPVAAGLVPLAEPAAAVEAPEAPELAAGRVHDPSS